MTEPVQRPENEAILKAQSKAIDDAIEGRELPEKVGTAQVTATTLKGATCAVKRSRGTLLLTTGPFEDAPIGTPFRMLVIGR